METFRTNDQSLKYLLQSIHERKLALPDFQRNFVWQPAATEELLESIARSFPAGSLLFMAWRNDAFSPREVQAAPPLNGHVPGELILDGQQRLSSLYQACYGRGEHRYFIDLASLLQLDDIEEALFYRHRSRCGRYETTEQQATELVVPLGVIFGASGGFHRWMDAVLEQRAQEPTDGNMREGLHGVYEQYIRPIEDYRFPVVTLDRDTSLEAICSIFETLNRTGVRLSVFELLAARFFAQGLDLRSLWARTREERAIIGEFEVDEYYVLQAIALRTRNSVKRGDVLKLSVQDIEEHWDAVTRGFRSALEMLRDECGVITGRWLPYPYQLVPLAALWEEAIEIAGPASGTNRGRLKRWFWCTAFGRAFDRAANSQATKDFTELRIWIGGGEAPVTVREVPFATEELGEITPRQQAVYKAAMALVLRDGPLDFHHASVLTPASIETLGADDHHIFPRGYLADANEGALSGAPGVDSILNRTLIDADTNRRIGKRAPSDYLAEIRKELASAGPDAFVRVLHSHLLPADDESPLLADDFVRFVAWRREQLAERISEATGGLSADLELVGVGEDRGDRVVPPNTPT